ncbi:isoamylase early set domain-containing protein [Rhodohalobacter halophilus]|uniref:isoamylase early set domain-containing protein n=1 Tax=Rhodohalobacter halophilus TaxID=1812810 RepID=UPI00083FAD98|nr:isoamylase early set domain-containing protein [Rhodohalobacter halophilus]
MLSKAYTPKRTVCKVTFTLPGEWADQEVKLVGDFNDWDRKTDSMKKNKKGNWEITKRLKPESNYKFRYLIDGEHWENDDHADQYVPNEFGSEDSVVITGK